MCCRLFLTDFYSFRMSDVLVTWWGVLQAISHRFLQFQNEWCVSEVMRWCVAGYFSQIPAVSEWVMYWWGDMMVCCRLFLTDPSSFRMSDVSVRWCGGVLQAISHRYLQFQNEWCVDEVMRWCVAGYFSQIPAMGAIRARVQVLSLPSLHSRLCFSCS